ncbi:hypothetical protein [Azospirillum sp.]|uniref:hypothetical protein n=1 Tax=Azospirillum sp. TaxID=34012 RepID=UPI003D74BBCE
MSIAAVPLDSAAPRSASAPIDASVSSIVRSRTDDPYNETADMSFGDFLDMINPLQHIPVVGTIYRAVTGDTIKPASQVIGGIAFGGPIGGVAAIANAIFAQANGRSLEDTMLAGLGVGTGEPAVEVAEASAAAAQAPAPQAAPAAPTTGAAPVAAPAVQAAAAQAAAQPAPQTVAMKPADKAASPIGDHKPSKMPVRDTMLATSLQSKNAAAIAQKSRLQASTPPVLNPGTITTASAANANAAAPAQQQPQQPVAVPPEMISDVMMRNLAKYEAAKKALNPTPPSIRTAG